MDFVGSAIVAVLVLSLGLMFQGWVLAAAARGVGEELPWTSAMVTVVVATIANGLLGAVMTMVLAPRLLGVLLGYGVWVLAIVALDRLPVRIAAAIAVLMTVLTWAVGLVVGAFLLAVGVAFGV